MCGKFRSCLRSAGCAVLLSLSVCVFPASAEDEVSLVFGLYTTDKPTVMVKTFRPILSAIESDLSESLGVSVTIKTHISPTYEKGVAALVNGDVDFARFGPASYITASELNPDIRILALDSKNNKQSTKGLIIVHEKSSIKNIEDLAGARFAFGNAESTIGRYLSQAYLLNHGISASELQSYVYLQRHDRVGHAVANGSYDAGALKEGTYKKLKKANLPIRALGEFDNVNKPWIANSDMQEDLFNALREVMFNLSAPEAFDALGRKQFVVGNDADFEDIRKAMAINETFFRSAESANTAESVEQ